MSSWRSEAVLAPLPGGLDLAARTKRTHDRIDRTDDSPPDLSVLSIPSPTRRCRFQPRVDPCTCDRSDQSDWTVASVAFVSSFRCDWTTVMVPQTLDLIDAREYTVTIRDS